MLVPFVEIAAVLLFLLLCLICTVKAVESTAEYFIDMWEPTTWLGNKMKSFTKLFMKASVRIPGFPVVPILWLSSAANASPMFGG